MCRGEVLLAFLAFAIVAVCAKRGYGPGDQDWGYVEVRKGAHMFYWLYKTSAKVQNYTARPLAIWLQGGPGASSTGYGNFEEIGPIDVNGNSRNYTWVKNMNVLFIDNPVGTGFSYVDKSSLLTTNNTQIALDLVSLMKGFYAKHPEFEKVPLHIFCESYGGKMAPEFALELQRAIQRKQIRSNLTSVVLGDPWTSPIDSVLNWAPLLWNMGIVDLEGYGLVMAEAYKTLDLINKGKWVAATDQWGYTQGVVLSVSKGVDFYNIEKKTAYHGPYLRSLQQNNYQDLMYRTLVTRAEVRDAVKLQNLMRGPVSRALNIPYKVNWGSQSQEVFSRLSGDFMKPAVHIVNELLQKTPLKVSVLSGQLDLICATPGTVNWVDTLVWSGRYNYISAPRQALVVDGILEGYKKSAKNFTMYWVNRAGHMVPSDNPAAMSYILKDVTNFG